MGEPKPLPACYDCDHICEVETADGECWGRMTQAERIAFGQALITQSKQDSLTPLVDPPGEPGESLITRRRGR